MKTAFKIFPLILLVLFLSIGLQLAGQQGDAEKKERAPWEHDHKHLLGAGFGFTLVPLGDELGDNDARGLWAPMVELDYFHRFHKRWGAGFLGAVELDHYVVTDDQVERENAVNLALVGMFSPGRYLDLFVGGGMEIEQHDNLPVFRIGTQYTIHMGQHWAIVPKLYFDFKGNYNTWTFAVCLARKF